MAERVVTMEAGSGLAGGRPDGGPRFDATVPRGGYAWWYVDALSDDGRHGITLIAFIGSVFSPFYAWSRRDMHKGGSGGGGDPANHCCLNVALYGRPRRWAMTERGRGALDRSARHLAIGPSRMEWDGEVLTIHVEEVTAPLPSRLRGIVRVRPGALTGRRFGLDDAGRHRWSPIAPVSRVEVELTHPALRWSGPGYLDTNDGDAPLESDFVQWDWCRAPTRDGAAILYNAQRRVGGEQSLALRINRAGTVERVEPPPPAILPRTRWGVARPTRADAGAVPAVRQTLEDAPFYSRSVIETALFGERVTAVHESLSLDRFRAPWVQAMLPFRIPRRWGG